MNLVSFGSDNHSGIHPEILQALGDANSGHCPAYGQDELSKQLNLQVQRDFHAVDSFLVFNGTAANVLCLQSALKSFEAVICSDMAHLHIDECGAPEKIAGVKVIVQPSKNGKLIPEELEKVIFRKGDQHHSQIKMLSITQPTEYGTLYSLSELQWLKTYCEKHNLYFHIDGARLGNAAEAMNLKWKDLCQYADIISFGGTKNGLLAGELVVIRHKELAKDFKFYRKQALQLPSKTRFFAASFLKYFEDNLWRKIARHENQEAQRLHDLIGQKTNLTITQPTQANSVFCLMPKSIIKPLRKKYFFYVWNENTYEVRLMTSFDTKSTDVESFVNEITKLTQNPSEGAL